MSIKSVPLQYICPCGRVFKIKVLLVAHIIHCSSCGRLINMIQVHKIKEEHRLSKVN
jgi:hypothetical protein